jgi:hypothetical protein
MGIFKIEGGIRLKSLHKEQKTSITDFMCCSLTPEKVTINNIQILLISIN